MNRAFVLGITLILLSGLIPVASAQTIAIQDSMYADSNTGNTTSDSFFDMDLSHKVIAIVLFVILVGVILVALYFTKKKK